jgi:hypothetical protein
VIVSNIDEATDDQRGNERMMGVPIRMMGLPNHCDQHNGIYQQIACGIENQELGAWAKNARNRKKKRPITLWARADSGDRGPEDAAKQKD